MISNQSTWHIILFDENRQRKNKQLLTKNQVRNAITAYSSIKFIYNCILRNATQNYLDSCLYHILFTRQKPDYSDS